MSRPALTLPVVFIFSACKAYQMPSSSMEPTILAGDYVAAAILFDTPARKQIVIYEVKGLAYVKRIVGLPGDTLTMRDGTLIVNGETLVEPYARHEGERPVTDSSFAWQGRYLMPRIDPTRYHPTLTTWGPIVVPPDRYFVLGDNRGESADSRYTGLINDADIFARPVFVYFSRDRQTGKVRWGRVGTRIRDVPATP